MTEFHEINDNIKIDFDIPEILKDLMSQAEDADRKNNLGLYLNLADTIDNWSKNYFADGVLSSKQWRLICMRYPQ